jgi:hypothetical protein
MSEVTAVLERAWKRIEDREHWCYGAAARDAIGTRVRPFDPVACRFCAVGSLFAEKVSNNDRNIARTFLDKAAQEVFTLVLPTDVNDVLGHDAVRRMYARAIEKSKETDVSRQQIGDEEPVS